MTKLDDGLNHTTEREMAGDIRNDPAYAAGAEATIALIRDTLDKALHDNVAEITRTVLQVAFARGSVAERAARSRPSVAKQLAEALEVAMQGWSPDAITHGMKFWVQMSEALAAYRKETDNEA